MSQEAISLWISHSWTLFSLRWGERAEAIVNNEGVNALVYMMPHIDETSESDYAAQVMVHTSYTIREYIDGMVAIISPYQDETLKPETP